MKYFSLGLAVLVLTAVVNAQEAMPQAFPEPSELDAGRAWEQETETPSKKAVDAEQSFEILSLFTDEGGQKIFQNWGSCDPCRNACHATLQTCKASCGFNISCIFQCDCDFYFCVDACTDCGPQDGPPAHCS